MATPYNSVSRDAARALSEFSDELRGALALGSFETWASQNGLVRSTDALKTTFPIPLSAAGFNEFKGDYKYRSLYSRSLSMKSKTYQDGVEELSDVIEAPDFIDWPGEPARIATEWQRFANVLVAAMLESGAGADGPLLDFYRDADSNTASTRQLFASDHPFNVLDSAVGSFDNDFTTTVAEIQNGTFFDTLEEYFRSIKGPNGKGLGLTINGGNILVPPSKAGLFKKALKDDTLIRAVSSTGVPDAAASVVAAVTTKNMWQNQIGYTVVYALAAGKPGLYPWIVQQGSSLEEIVCDKQSQKWKDTRKVSLAFVGQANVAACLPQRIAKVTITG